MISKLSLKNTLPILASVLLISCSFNSPSTVYINKDIEIKRYNNNLVSLLEENNKKVSYEQKEATINLNKDISGATISFNIKLNNSFSVKANEDGQAPKSASDISKYIVYLLKHSSSSGYPSSGDPLDTPFEGPFTINKTSDTQTIRFVNVVDSGTDYYYIAIQALDSLDNNIIKRNTNWGLVTQAGANGRVAVSSGGGVGVDSSYQITTGLSNLSISPQLEDKVGATLRTNVTPVEGVMDSLVGNLNDLMLGTFAGGGTSTSEGVPATTLELISPKGITSDKNGNIYIVDSNTSKIKKVDSSGNIYTFAGGGASTSEGTLAANFQFTDPFDVAIDSKGNVYVSETSNNRIRVIKTDGKVYTYAGGGSILGNGGNALLSEVLAPKGLEFDIFDNLYIAESGRSLVRKVNRFGIISSFAGGGAVLGDSGDATSAKLVSPYDIAINNNGIVYITDSGDYRVRIVNLSNKIDTVSGDGTNNSSGEGINASSAQINPAGISIDSSNNVYISDVNSSKVRVIDSSNIIKTLTGQGSSTSSSVKASEAQLTSPTFVFADRKGSVLVSEFNRVRGLF